MPIKNFKIRWKMSVIVEVNIDISEVSGIRIKIAAIRTITEILDKTFFAGRTILNYFSHLIVNSHIHSGSVFDLLGKEGVKKLFSEQL